MSKRKEYHIKDLNNSTVIKQKFRTGDSIVYKQKNGLTDLYGSTAGEQNPSNLEAPLTPSKIINMKAKWQTATTLEDFKQLAELEKTVSKNRFKILIVQNDNLGLFSLSKILKDINFKSIVCASSFSDAVSHLNNQKFNLVLSAYRLNDTRDGRQLYLHIQEKQIDTQFLMVSDFNEFERNNLAHIKVPTLPAPKEAYAPKEYKEIIKTKILQFYMANLIKDIYGNERYLKVKNKVNRVITPKLIQTFERASTKNQFKILVVDDEPMLVDIVVDSLAQIGFRSTVVADSHESAIEELENNKFDLVLCDYELPSKTVKHGAGKALFDFLKQKEKNEKLSTQFVLISGYHPTQLENLKKYGILCLNKIQESEDDLEFLDYVNIITKGVYVKLLRLVLTSGLE